MEKKFTILWFIMTHAKDSWRDYAIWLQSLSTTPGVSVGYNIWIARIPQGSPGKPLGKYQVLFWKDGS